MQVEIRQDRRHGALGFPNSKVVQTILKYAGDAKTANNIQRISHSTRKFGATFILIKEPLVSLLIKAREERLIDHEDFEDVAFMLNKRNLPEWQVVIAKRLSLIA